MPVNPRSSILPQRAPCGQYGKIRQKIHPGLSTPGAHHCHTSPPPTVPTVFRNMAVTLVVIAVIGVFVFALDFGLNKLLGLIMEVAPIS